MKQCELLLYSRQHFDRTVVLNDQLAVNIVREKLSIRASFLTGESVFEATSSGR